MTLSQSDLMLKHIKSVCRTLDTKSIEQCNPLSGSYF